MIFYSRTALKQKPDKQEELERIKGLYAD